MRPRTLARAALATVAALAVAVAAGAACPDCPICVCVYRATIPDVSTPAWKAMCAGFPAIQSCADPGWPYGGPEPWLYVDVGARMIPAPLVLYAGESPAITMNAEMTQANILRLATKTSAAPSAA